MYLSNNIVLGTTRQKAKNALDQIEFKLANGEITSQEQLVSEIETAWSTVFSSNLETSIEVPDYRDGELPLKSMLEAPLFQAQNDITSLWEYLNQLRDKLKDHFNTQRSEILGIRDLIGQIQNKTTTLQLFSSDSENSFLWSSDSFTSLEKVKVEDTTASIDTSVGEATIKPTSLQSINQYITSVTIDKSASIGVPGSNTVISKVGGPTSPDDKNVEPVATLEGEVTSTSLVGYGFDGSPGTSFEWESVYIPRKQKCKKIGAAFHYDTGGVEIDVLNETEDQAKTDPGWRKFVKWPGDTEFDRGPDGKGYFIVDFDKPRAAKLVFNITLDQPRKISTIQITPQLVGGIYTIVRSIRIGRDGELGYTREIAKDVYLTEKLNESLSAGRSNIPEANYAGVGIWTIPDYEVKFIKVVLEAGGFYTPKSLFGHHFYFRIIHEKKREKVLGFTVGGSDKEWPERLPNPDSVISVGGESNLSGIGGVIGLLAGGSVGGLIGSTLGSLFGSSTERNIVRQGDAHDIFTGSRSVIALKDIDLSIREYATQSVIVSQPHYFFTNLEAISIISTENIPTDWDQNTEWVKFEVSVDGQVWVPIVPQNRSKGKDDVVFVEGANTVLVRITLTRPNNRPNETPKLLHYTIKATRKL